MTNKPTQTEPPFKEVKGESLIGCYAITQISRQNILEFIIESVHFIKDDNHVGFYELFTLCVEGLPVTGDVDDVSLFGFLHVRQELTYIVKVTLHCKKRLAIFPSPAGMSLPTSPLAGIMTS